MNNPRVCYFCIHFYMNMAECDWSELTPGQDWSMGCLKGKWHFDSHEDNLPTFRKCLQTASICELFKEEGNG